MQLLFLVISVSYKDRVAPHAGAWIETKYTIVMRETMQVAPHAGAWIETRLERLNRAP